MNAMPKAALVPHQPARGVVDRYKSGVLPYKQMGYWQPDYVADRNRRDHAVPHHAAGWRRCRGSRGGQ